MTPDTELHLALTVVWVITLAVTYRLCVRDSLREFIRAIRTANRRTHRRAGLLSISPTLWRGPRRFHVGEGQRPGLSARRPTQV
jgi:hypothetical protein